MKNLFSKVEQEFKDIYHRLIGDNWSMVKEDTDVVSCLDISVNLAMARIFKEIDEISFYGEESRDKISGKPEMIAVCDPIDGTRPLVEGLYYSAFCLSIWERKQSSYKYHSGIMILINNQNHEMTTYITIDGVVYADGKEMVSASPLRNVSINESVLDYTMLKQYDKDGKKAKRYELMLALCDKVRHLTNFVSGGATIMNVVQGRVDAFVNPNPATNADIQSHPVALEIAKSLGLAVCSMNGQEYDNRLLLGDDGVLRRPNDDYTLVVCNPSIQAEVLELTKASEIV